MRERAVERFVLAKCKLFNNNNKLVGYLCADLEKGIFV